VSVAERSELCLPPSFAAAEVAGLCPMPLPRELAQDYEKAVRDNNFSQLIKNVSAPIMGLIYAIMIPCSLLDRNRYST
jgi:hypothetical protein